jgi:hypothetical protein
LVPGSGERAPARWRVSFSCQSEFGLLVTSLQEGTDNLRRVYTSIIDAVCVVLPEGVLHHILTFLFAHLFGHELRTPKRGVSVAGGSFVERLQGAAFKHYPWERPRAYYTASFQARLFALGRDARA